MKKLLPSLLILCSILAIGNNGKPGYAISTSLPDTSILSQILALPLQSYIGKPVDSLFNVLPGGYAHRGFMTPKVGYANGVFQGYFTSQSNNCTVEIYVDTFYFLTFPNYTVTTSWSMTLAKKETIAFIKVYRDNTVCVYGCNNANYHNY